MKGFVSIKELDFVSFLVAVENQILLSKYEDNSTIDKEKALQIIEDSYTFIKSYKLNFGLIDNRAAFLNTTEEARQLLSNNKSLKLLKAQAVLVKTLADRINTNYFIQVSKPIIPFKAFEEEVKALKWLENFKTA